MLCRWLASALISQRNASTGILPGAAAAVQNAVVLRRGMCAPAAVHHAAAPAAVLRVRIALCVCGQFVARQWPVCSDDGCGPDLRTYRLPFRRRQLIPRSPAHMLHCLAAFWLKDSVAFEQPNVTFSHDVVVVLDTLVDGSAGPLAVWASDPTVSKLLGSAYRPATVRVRARETAGAHMRTLLLPPHGHYASAGRDADATSSTRLPCLVIPPPCCSPPFSTSTTTRSRTRCA